MFINPKQAYLDTRANSSVAGASPHKLISLLFDACQEKLAIAKGCMERREIKEKAEAIKKAIDIIVRLQASLDFDQGGNIAIQLDDLYTFCTNRLALANAVNDISMIDEVYKVITEIKNGWRELEGFERL
ncbi:flagellar export chaperone FliS [Luminiphilus sp.]|nr:flagellar export chaperone FliS [Luminiphilus sp.]MDC3251031.1 flagellar export chaperone FliS [Luminiphilus sp.]